MSTIQSFGLGFLGIVWIVTWSFQVWRRFRKEYEYDDLFRFQLIVITSILFGLVVGSFFQWVWGGGVVGFYVGMYLAHTFSHVDMWEVGDFSLVQLLGIATLTLTTANDMFRALVVGSVFLVSIFITLFHRKIRWYRSGKPGLAYLSALFLLSLLEFPFAFRGGVGVYLVILFGVVFSLTTIVIRSRTSPVTLWPKIIRKRRKSTSLSSSIQMRS